MPPDRSHDNVDGVDEVDGEESEGEIQTIQIANSKKGSKVMCEVCSSILKSAASLARHKKSKHGSYNKYMCPDCGVISKTQKEHSNHKRKHNTFDCHRCGKTFADNGNKMRHLERCKGHENNQEMNVIIKQNIKTI